MRSRHLTIRVSPDGLTNYWPWAFCNKCHVGNIYRELKVKTGEMAYKMRAQTGNKQKQFIKSGKMGLEAKALYEAEEANAKRNDGTSTIAPVTAAEPEPAPVVTYATAAAGANQIAGAAPVGQVNVSAGLHALSAEDYAFYQAMRERQLLFDQQQQQQSGQSNLMQGQFAQPRQISVMSPGMRGSHVPTSMNSANVLSASVNLPASQEPHARQPGSSANARLFR